MFPLSSSNRYKNSYSKGLFKLALKEIANGNVNGLEQLQESKREVHEESIYEKGNGKNRGIDPLHKVVSKLCK